MNTPLHKGLIVFLRLCLGWTFLYAAIHQFADPTWSSAGFLAGTKTFHSILAPFGAPAVVPYTDVLVKWGHLLIGLSLISGLLVRVSSVFGIMLMLVYYMAHMDFPYIDNKLNYIVEFHIVYAGVLVYLNAVDAGTVWGLDAIAERIFPALAPHDHGGAKPAMGDD